jgi:hypothetical protein
LLDEVLVEEEVAAGLGLGLGVDAGAGEDVLSVAVLFSVFDSVDAAGLSAFASRSPFPPSDFGAEPLSPFG